MIEIPFLWTEIIFTALWILVRIITWAIQKRIDWKQEALLVLMYINLAVLIRFTFFPMALKDGRVQPLLFDPASVFPFRINLIPFVRMTDYQSKRDFLVNLIGNIAMFVPTGIILPIIYKKLDSFGKVILAGMGISLCIEILQLPFSVRASDIDDLLLNTLGVLIGYGIYWCIRRLRKRPVKV